MGGTHCPPPSARACGCSCKAWWAPWRRQPLGHHGGGVTDTRPRKQRDAVTSPWQWRTHRMHATRAIVRSLARSHWYCDKNSTPYWVAKQAASWTASVKNCCSRRWCVVATAAARNRGGTWAPVPGSTPLAHGSKRVPMCSRCSAHAGGSVGTVRGGGATQLACLTAAATARSA